MGEFRVYFYAYNGEIVGRYDLEASTEEQILRIAEMLGAACCDMCTLVQVWQGPRLVGTIKDRSSDRMGTVSEWRQHNIVQIEEAIRDDGWPVGRSQELLDRLAEAKAETLREDCSANPEIGNDRRLSGT